jgi:hypothetical protein
MWWWQCPTLELKNNLSTSLEAFLQPHRNPSLLRHMATWFFHCSGAWTHHETFAGAPQTPMCVSTMTPSIASYQQSIPRSRPWPRPVILIEQLFRLRIIVSRIPNFLLLSIYYSSHIYYSFLFEFTFITFKKTFTDILTSLYNCGCPSYNEWRLFLGEAVSQIKCLICSLYEQWWLKDKWRNLLSSSFSTPML